MPWTPEKGKLYVPEQDLIEKKNKDSVYEDVKLDPSKEKFYELVPQEHEPHVVEVIKLHHKGELAHLHKKPSGGSCALL